MTNIQACSNGERHTIVAKGHATGSIECCAAVSMLMYTLATYILDHDVKFKEMSFEDADVAIDFFGAKEAYDVIVVGCRTLSESYPQFVNFVCNEGEIDNRA